MNNPSATAYPLRGNKERIFNLSLAAGLLMAVLSILGMLLSGQIYPDPGLAESFLPNDLVNILLGLPLFLFALVGLKQEKWIGPLLLPGALIYVIYNYTAYLLGRSVDWITLFYLALVALAAYTLVLLLSKMDHQRFKDRLQGRVPERFSGWILVAFGLVFIGLAVSQILTGLQNGTIPPLGENAVAVADILLSVGWVAGGILLLTRQPVGYTAGLGLLVAASFLFLGLVLFFFLAPPLTGRPFDWGEVVTVLGMGLIAFVPTGLYWRGVMQSEEG